MPNSKKIIRVLIESTFNDDGTLDQEITINADEMLHVFEAVPLLEEAIRNLRRGYEEHLKKQ